MDDHTFVFLALIFLMSHHMDLPACCFVLPLMWTMGHYETLWDIIGALWDIIRAL